MEEVVRSGKTVFIFLSEIQEVLINKDVRKTPPYIDDSLHNPFESKEFCNYDILPIQIGKIVPKSVKEISTSKNFEIVSSYWANFCYWTKSDLYIEKPSIKPLLTAKDGNKVICGYKQLNKGFFVFLPMLRNIEDELVGYDPYADRPVGYEKVEEVGKTLRTKLLEIHKELHLSERTTIQPDWVSLEDYRLTNELRIVQDIEKEEKVILEFQIKIDEIKMKIQEMEGELTRERNLKRLLHETGKPLELSVVEALRILGFRADNYTDGFSEFDSIFIGPEGKFLGEVEGRDNGAIAIEKLRQLKMNLDEDFDKDETNVYAKGVLFGNAFRLKPLKERGGFFTDKCVMAAKISGIALVKTPDLFFVARYLKANDNPEFARKCREAIKNTEGDIVVFPEIPAS